MQEDNNVRQIPVVALRALVIMPDMIIHFDLSRDFSIRAVEKTMSTDQEIFLVTQKDTEVKEPNFDTVYHVGTLAKIKQIIKLPGGIIRVLVDGISRASLLCMEKKDDILLGQIKVRQTIIDMSEVQMQAAKGMMLEQLKQLQALSKKETIPAMKQLKDLEDLEKQIDIIGMNMPFVFEKKQMLLEEESLKNRYEQLTLFLANEIEVAKVRVELTDAVKKRIDKNQKNYMLKEQMNYIKKELGEDEASEVELYFKQLEKIKASDEVKEKIRKEILRFQNASGSSSEAAMQRGYVETLLEMPWDLTSKDELDLKHAIKVLDEDHYGMVKVKERVLEFLAVRALKQQRKEQEKENANTIICLLGPPGTGKTSIAKSIARALNRKYVRICLGGVRDEAEIRGHRKTYVGAMPGRVVTAIKQAGVKNPVILLDEIDKMSSDYKGDSASALLEVLDAEQNIHFRDHYLEIPLDLSQVIFIATANDISGITGPLKDRLEIIELSSYTQMEKFHIAKDYLIKKQREKNGLKAKQFSITDKALKKIIANYTREAGVRECERSLGKLARKSALKILTEDVESVKISGSNLKEFLGKEKYKQEKISKLDAVGIVRGLAWTSVGGDTLEIEVNCMPGKGELKLTGKLGDVMKESAQTGISYIRSVSKQYEIAADYFKENDIHIHIPEGAVPKDGPSAGITMATAVLSAITGKKVRHDIAMTGEITLRGRVLAIGGLKEKTLAAKNAGVTTILVPKENEKDLEEIEDEIKKGLEIIFVSHMEEVIQHAFFAETA